MRLLLDTHAVIWWFEENPKLRPAAAAAIANTESQVYISAACVWEMSIKKALGKLRTPDDIQELMAIHGFHELPVTIDHAILAGSLPRHHDDPFDRLLIAQARLEGLTFVSCDRRMAQYGVAVLEA